MSSRVLHTGDLRRRWTLAFVVGEFVGFVPPAATGAALVAVDAPDAVLIGALAVAGSLEGAVLGLAQSWVLARSAPTIDRRRWVAATMIAAGFAWLVGMSGGAIAGSDVLPPAILLAVLIPAWTAAVLAMGMAQWLVLRLAVPRSVRWIWVTAGAWLVGVMIPVTALSVMPNGWPLWSHAAVGVLAAMAMGLTVGTLTGRTLERLLSRS